ncbi:HK97 family phage prohead protease [Bradyrhizobium sp. SEMIA]|uniref:HK97 family phage prohead protease n=1 Tax=Bradyrhizobium sp. SEMIA TaxID=2597515 RepID=UPI0018A634E9|nr:HK97 family phage prohead protease [Bradyrhizobium sp. SEMIA]QOG17532.1 hypothetical protein FOM02_09425 [Bradyrhizobium sp. SEMIA]
MTFSRRNELRRLVTTKRFAAVAGAPRTFDPDARTVDAVLSKGSAVQRSFGKELLRIDKNAVDLSRLKAGGIPLLDSHEQRGIANALGRIARVWFENATLLGRIRFNETPEGSRAMGMVERGELTSLSVGYMVNEWEVRDVDGHLLDPERDRIPYGEELVFEATRWSLLEVSLVSVPADSAAMVRDLGAPPPYIRDTLARMRARQRMIGRMR